MMWLKFRPGLPGWQPNLTSLLNLCIIGVARSWREKDHDLVAVSFSASQSRICDFGSDSPIHSAPAQLEDGDHLFALCLSPRSFIRCITSRWSNHRLRDAGFPHLAAFCGLCHHRLLLYYDRPHHQTHVHPSNNQCYPLRCFRQRSLGQSGSR